MPTPVQPTFSWPIRVYYEDTDAAGVVFYANYLKFMERARTEWLRALGYGQQALRGDAGLIFVVTRVNLEIKRPARLDDALTVVTSLAYRGHAALDFVQVVQRDADDCLCARGEVRIGCVSIATMRPTRIPSEIFPETLAELTPEIER